MRGHYATTYLTNESFRDSLQANQIHLLARLKETRHLYLGTLYCLVKPSIHLVMRLHGEVIV